jgi:hypothetical protein
MKRAGFTLFLAGLIIFFTVPRGVSATPEPLPKFQEIYQLLLTNNSGLTDAELNRAAVQGLLDQLQSRVVLVTNNSNADAKADLVSKISIFDKGFAYLRVRKVEEGLSADLNADYQQLAATNKIKGVVLDLRYAGGTDYAAAAKSADLFLKTEQTLLQWDDSTASSTAKKNAVSVPLAVLVNHKTSGAAEALAGIVRQTHIGLVIGTNTAGQASVFKDFALDNGQHLKVATAPVKMGNGKEISSNGLKPDIEIAVSAEDEKSLYENPYRTKEISLSESEADSGGVETNRPRRRLNEAELVRLQRQGISPEDAFLDELGKEPQPSKPVLSDPALVRALDLLKGLAVVQQSRRN